MIKSCLKLKENIDVSQFPKSDAFFKHQSFDYKPKQSNVLTADKVTKFMANAPDKEWLLNKVIIVFKVFGACRRDNLSNLRIDDVKDNGSCYKVFLKDGETHYTKEALPSLMYVRVGCIFSPCILICIYINMRPLNITN